MAERRRTPKDPEDTKGGVRGTHGLGDAPRDPKRVRPVATQGGTASQTGRSAKGQSTRLRREAQHSGRKELENQEVGDASVDEEAAYEHGLVTRPAPGPGPKDRDAGSAGARELDQKHLRHKD